MLIEEDYSLTKMLTTVKHEINRAALDKKHPMRFIVLGTQGDQLAMRYVVLRHVDDDFNLYIYTDSRTKKVRDVMHNPEIQVLFYHPNKKAQVIITGIASIHTKNEVSNQHWQNVQGEPQKAYNSVLPPGTEIESYESAYDWNLPMTPECFSVIKIEPSKIEILQLDKLTHIRVKFDKNNGWQGQYLVP